MYPAVIESPKGMMLPRLTKSARAPAAANSRLMQTEAVQTRRMLFLFLIALSQKKAMHTNEQA